LPNNVNISIPDIDGEFMVIRLDREGIACSTKSACIKDTKTNSYVIDALRKDGPKNSLRFTLGRLTTKKDLEYVVKILKKLSSSTKGLNFSCPLIRLFFSSLISK
jgi:cysteine desulfurase